MAQMSDTASRSIVVLIFVGVQGLLAAAPPQPASKFSGEDARAAVERALPTLQETSINFLKSSGCVSCHHNTLAVMTLAMARGQNIRVDEDLAFEHQELTAEYVSRWESPPPVDAPRDAATIANILLSLSIDGYPADTATDAMAELLARQQTETGAWRVPSRRFENESEDIALTATAIRALQVYAPKASRTTFESMIQRAGGWISKTAPASTEGRAFQVLGLAWSKAGPDRVRQATQSLAASQSADGGWSQIPDAPSDAYATGQALFALVEGGETPPTDPVYERGALFLLKSQQQNGTWFVQARPPMPPHIDTGYPIGRDQVSSIAATQWATMALALGAR